MPVPTMLWLTVNVRSAPTIAPFDSWYPVQFHVTVM